MYELLKKSYTMYMTVTPPIVDPNNPDSDNSNKDPIPRSNGASTAVIISAAVGGAILIATALFVRRRVTNNNAAEMVSGANSGIGEATSSGIEENSTMVAPVEDSLVEGDHA